MTSFREINWAQFTPNFYAVFERAALEHAPAQYVVLARVPGDTAVARLQRDVVLSWPNISSIDLSLIQRTIEGIVRQMATAVRFLAIFSVAMGLPVLFSAVAATRRARMREGVLLKTLGATRAQVRAILASEYAALGVMGALTGLLLSVGGSWALAHWVLKIDFVLSARPARRDPGRDAGAGPDRRPPRRPRRLRRNADGRAAGELNGSRLPVAVASANGAAAVPEATDHWLTG